MQIKPPSEFKKPSYPALLAAVAAMLAPACTQTAQPVSASSAQQCGAASGSQAQQMPNKEGKPAAREPRRLAGKPPLQLMRQQRLPGKRPPRPPKPTTDS